MAFNQGKAIVGGIASARLADQTPVRSHKTLTRDASNDFVFAFHDSEEVGPKMLARIAKHTGLKPEDL